MRRLLIILGVLVALLIIAAGLYFLFFASRGAHLTASTTNPFSDTGSSAATPQTVAQLGVPVGNAGTVVAPSFVEVTKNPVSAGFAVFDQAAASTTASSTNTSPDVVVRYIDRQSGNVYQYGALSRTLTRISDKTLPGIQEASWLPNGSTAFVRFLATTDGTQALDTYALPANGQGGYFLQQNLNQATTIGSNSLFTLSVGTDSSIGTISNADGSGQKTVFTSPLTELNVTAANGTYIAVTDAAATLPGYAFLATGSTFTPIVGPYDGLTAKISPSGKLLLYSYVDGSTLRMSVLNLSDGTTTVLPVATMTEKCVWKTDSSGLYCAVPSSFAGTLPDDWYQGVVSFSDRIWEVDLSSRLASLVFDPTQTVSTGIDAVNLTLDPNHQVLVFMNKKDYSLWAYSL